MTVPGANVLDIDAGAETERIAGWMRDVLAGSLHRRGIVIGISGGIDSAVCAALCVRAIGAARVFGLLMPERECPDRALELGRSVVSQLGVEHAVEDITGMLEAAGCYRRRDEAIRRLEPDYAAGWRNKLVLRAGDASALTRFSLVLEAPDGARSEHPLRLQEYLEIVAATGFKQRVRKVMEYFHADRLNFAVVGTPNRLEFDLGFFVKNGDGAADLKPVAHLYKSQVYALGRYLELPPEILSARPTTDTYTLPQGQDEFYFGLPYEQMDIALWAFRNGVPAADLGTAIGVPERQAADILAGIRRKRDATRYQHLPAVLVESGGAAC